MPGAGKGAPQLGVIGASVADAALADLAYSVGALAAERSWTVVCGGMGGVMEAASEGARSRGGLVVGILPGTSREDGNPYVSIALPTGMGEGRNVLVARCSDVLVAVGGGYGTLSEIALGLKMGKPVISLKSWVPDRTVLTAATAEEAVSLANRAFAQDS